jgi:hypothetical protein
MYLRRTFVVPKEEGKRKGKRGRGGKMKSAKDKKGKRARASSVDRARERAKEVIDPDVAVVVKDPLRVHILAIAIQRLISPSEFAREFDCPTWAAAYNFKVLERHGFLELVETIPVRGSTKHMYRATKSGYISSQDWRLVAPALQPGIAGAALRDLNNRVTDALELGTFGARGDAYLLWAPLTLDETAWEEFVGMMAWAYDEAKRLEIETVERRASEEAKDSFPATFIIAGFESPTAKALEAHGVRKEKEGRKRGAIKRNGNGKRETL